jgi:hypothetical protein
MTLNEHVKVSTMINPNRISETRSMGSSSRLNEMSMFSLGVDPGVSGVVIMLESIIKRSSPPSGIAGADRAPNWGNRMP